MFAIVAIAALTLACLSSFTSPTRANATTSYLIDAGQLTITLRDDGRVTGLTSKIDGADHVAAGHIVSLIRLLVDDAPQEPTSVTYDSASSTYTFDFSATDVQVDVKVLSNTDYASFEVTDVTAPSGVEVEALLWGPLTTSIAHTVGETAGVVYNDEFAIGIHALNDKTIGGWPIELDNLNYFDGSGPNRFPVHMNAAARTSWGSLLQAYSWDYTKPRTRTIGIPSVTGNYMPNQPVPALAGSEGELVGSKIALFGSWTPNVLPTIERIQLGEGLYHGTINGKWQKTAQETTQSYLVVRDLTAANMAQAAQYANQAGLGTVYSLDGLSGPWQSDGHYVFRSNLGTSDAAVKTAVDTAAAYGVKFAAHTLSDFISGADPYVKPVPHAALAKAGQATLTRPLDGASTDIYVSAAAPFQNGKGKVVQIDNELMSFATISAVSETEWKLSGGSRSGFGTAATSHATGATISRLWLNQYGGLLGGHDLIDDISGRLADAWNNTGTRGMSFDGLEGAFYAEYGPYDLNSFVSNMLDNVADKDGFIAEASTASHNIWGTLSRAGWGERNTSMGQRYVNMTYAERNFQPKMMGWLYLDTYATVGALEYALSKMAAWNAGMAMQSSVLNLSVQPAGYLDKIKQWETARNLGAFTADQRTRMMDMSTYWTLTVVQPGVKWSLQQTDSTGAAIGAAEQVFVGNTAGSQNVALGKPVTFSGSTSQSVAYANDGDASSSGRWVGVNAAGKGWMQIDLGAKVTVSQIKLWQHFGDSRTYHDVVVQLSNDPSFAAGKTVTVFNNDADNSSGLGAGTDPEYAETAAGRSIHVDDVSARYVRFWANGNTVNPYDSWVEAQVFQAPRNVASGITPTFSGPISRSASNATDGSIDTAGWVGLNTAGKGWMQLDLGVTRTINRIKLWQFWGNGRTYHDVVVQLSNDPTFAAGVTTVYNNDVDNSSGLGTGSDTEYAETSDGKAIVVNSVNARYVRFWASGNTTNPYNSWVEAQVFGF